MARSPSQKTIIDAQVNARVSSSLRDAYQAICTIPLSDLFRVAMENEIVRVVSNTTSTPINNVNDAIEAFIEYRQKYLDKENEDLSILRNISEDHKAQRALLEEQVAKFQQEKKQTEMDEEIRHIQKINERDRIYKLTESRLTPDEVEKYGSILRHNDGDPKDLIADAITKVMAATSSQFDIDQIAWWITSYLQDQYYLAHPADEEEEAHA